MGKAKAVEFAIPRLKIARNPGAVLTRTRHHGTLVNHFRKRRIHPILEEPFLENLLERLLDPEILRLQHETRIGRKPRYGHPLPYRPRKNAAGVGVEQPLRIVIAADRQQPIVFRLGLFRGRKTERIVSKPIDRHAFSYFEVEAKARLRIGANVPVGDFDVRRMDRVPFEGVLGFERRIKHHVGVRTRKALRTDGDIHEPRHHALEPFEPGLDSGLDRSLVFNLVFQFPKYDVLYHIFLSAEHTNSRRHRKPLRHGGSFLFPLFPAHYITRAAKYFISSQTAHQHHRPQMRLRLHPSIRKTDRDLRRGALEFALFSERCNALVV